MYCEEDNFIIDLSGKEFTFKGYYSISGKDIDLSCLNEEEITLYETLTKRAIIFNGREFELELSQVLNLFLSLSAGEENSIFFSIYKKILIANSMEYFLKFNLN